MEIDILKVSWVKLRILCIFELFKIWPVKCCSLIASDIYLFLFDLQKLDFQLGRPLAIQFLRRYSKAAHAIDKIHLMAKYFLEISSVIYKMSHYHPSEVRRSCTLPKVNLWYFDYPVDCCCIIDAVHVRIIGQNCRRGMDENPTILYVIHHCRSTTDCRKISSNCRRSTLRQIDIHIYKIQIGKILQNCNQTRTKRSYIQRLS